MRKLASSFPRDLVLFASLILTATIAYIASVGTAAPWSDGADIAAASLSLGQAHPPGYPLLILLGHTWISWGGILSTKNPAEIAYSLNILNALFSIGTAAILWLITREILKGIPQTAETFACLFATTLIVCSPRFWQAARYIEVNTFQFFLHALFLYTCLRPFKQEREYAPFFCFGLLFSHHPGNFLYFPLLLIRIYRREKRMTGISAAAFFALGASPMLSSIFRGSALYAWGDPQTLLDGLGSAFALKSLTSNILFNANMYWERLIEIPALLFQEMNIALPLSVVGLVIAFRTQRRSAWIMLLSVALTFLPLLRWSTPEWGVFSLLMLAPLLAMAALAVGHALAFTQQNRKYTRALYVVFSTYLLWGTLSSVKEGVTTLHSPQIPDEHLARTFLEQGLQRENAVLVVGVDKSSYLAQYLSLSAGGQEVPVLQKFFFPRPPALKRFLHRHNLHIPSTYVEPLPSSDAHAQAKRTPTVLNALVSANPGRVFLLDEITLRAYRTLSELANQHTLPVLPEGFWFRVLSGPAGPKEAFTAEKAAAHIREVFPPPEVLHSGMREKRRAYFLELKHAYHALGLTALAREVETEIKRHD